MKRLVPRKCSSLTHGFLPFPPRLGPNLVLREGREGWRRGRARGRRGRGLGGGDNGGQCWAGVWALPGERAQEAELSL